MHLERRSSIALFMCGRAMAGAFILRLEELKETKEK
jgi:hypothetical protein